MSELLDLNEYKTRIADLYDRRSSTYDESQWHEQICQTLLAKADIHAGQRILDIGTGTGHLAIAAARAIGTEGQTIGVDLSAKMLAIANQKIATLGLTNILLYHGDGENLTFPSLRFDRILSANTFPWIENKAVALRLWYDLLEPDGLIGIHSPADTAYVGNVVLRTLFARYGVELEFSNRLGTLAMCRDLFANAGFTDIAIATEQHGSYIGLDKAASAWHNLSNLLSDPTMDFSTLLPPVRLAEVEAEFRVELERRYSDRGIWNDLTTWYVIAKKSH
ncbi:MAG: methyltransferase domain-containing protein [Cyanobacteria bacterium SBLK]|nr:methyltransferase domain-containing protein [Cyanobacteria bacterium SBLK]